MASDGTTNSFGMIELLLPICLLIILFIAICMVSIFTKAGKPGWAALVPFYNIIIFMEIIGKPWWWLFLWMIPYLNIIWVIWGWNLLAKSFGKSAGFALGIIFLPFIFCPILAFGDSKYIGPGGNKLIDPN
jgi:hypothetical protein